MPPLLELIKDKDNSLRMAKKKDYVLWKEAKRLRNDCTKRLRNARAEYIKENLEANQGNSKRNWSNIHDILPNVKKKSARNFTLYDFENDKDVDSKHTSNFINDFFINIGLKLERNKTSSFWIVFF